MQTTSTKKYPKVAAFARIEVENIAQGKKETLKNMKHPDKMLPVYTVCA